MSTAVAAPGSNAVAKNIPPNQSLYLQNLPEKLQKHDLKRNLYMLFSTYGPVLDVTAVKTCKMRGQAHVLFRDTNSATQAMRNCQGYDFFGKEMKISYAKTRSNTLAKLTGTFHDEQTTKSNAPNASTGAEAPPSSFPAPPGSLPAPPAGLPPPPGLPAKPNGQPAKSPAVEAAKAGAENTPSPASTAGQKRQREESDDEDGDAPMEEDSDEGGEMDMSDSD